MNYWTPLWHQAIAKGLWGGRLIGKNKTVCFRIKSYTSGEYVRLRFSNLAGKEDYQIGSLVLWVAQKAYIVKVQGRSAFTVPIGMLTYSDIINLSIHDQAEIEIRIFFKNNINDMNVTEEGASLYDGDQTNIMGCLSNPKHALINQLMGLYVAVPMLDWIEIQTHYKPKVIVAFGDSITSMNRWVKPLAERIHETYGNAFTLINAGIPGNCLLYEVKNVFGDLFGQKGIDRFQRDVLDVEHLHTVIVGLGINDTSYYNAKTKEVINFDRFTASLKNFAKVLHDRNVRMIVQTLSPRIGFKMLKYTPEMEALRIQINTWIRTCGLFDEVFDVDAIMRDSNKLNVIDERYHQGDYLHPNVVGGQVLADAFNLKRLRRLDEND